MSILIKGVEMPICRPLLVSIHSDGTVEVHEVNRYGWQTLQNAAVPVPPHGDLIERKAAYDSILAGMVMTGYQSRALDCISEFYVPAIIPAEEDEK